MFCFVPKEPKSYLFICPFVWLPIHPRGKFLLDPQDVRITPFYSFIIKNQTFEYKRVLDLPTNIILIMISPPNSSHAKRAKSRVKNKRNVQMKILPTSTKEKATYVRPN